MNKKTRIYLLLAVRSILFYVIFILMGLAMTGKTERAYPVLQPKDIVQAGTHGWTAEMMVKHFMPIVAYPEGVKGAPPLSTVFYEVMEDSAKYSIVYHFEWENQYHPSTVTNLFYSVFRFFYHGFTLRDSEIVQMDIGKVNGQVMRILYSGTLGKTTYQQPDAKRVRLEANWQPDQTFEVTKASGKGAAEVIGKLTLNPNVAPSFRVINWDHLMELLPTSEKLAEAKALQPEWLTDEKYRSDKYVRWEQGDYRSEETPANVPVMLFVSLIFTGYLFMLQKGYLERKVTPDAMDKERAKVKVK